jgi:hypothetical protein
LSLPELSGTARAPATASGRPGRRGSRRRRGRLDNTRMASEGSTEGSVSSSSVARTSSSEATSDLAHPSSTRQNVDRVVDRAEQAWKLRAPDFDLMLCWAGSSNRAIRTVAHVEAGVDGAFLLLPRCTVREPLSPSLLPTRRPRRCFRRSSGSTPRGPGLHRAQRPGQGSRLADGDVDPDQPTVTGELAFPAPRPRLLDAFIGHKAHQSAPLHSPKGPL